MRDNLDRSGCRFLAKASIMALRVLVSVSLFTTVMVSSVDYVEIDVRVTEEGARATGRLKRRNDSGLRPGAGQGKAG